MRPGVTLESRNPQISFIHYILRTLIGSDHRIEMLEIILKVISEIQIIAMLFSFPFEVLPNTNGDSFGVFTDKITKYISFKHILTFSDTSNLNNFLISLFLFYIIFMILIAALIANAYYSKARTGSFLLGIWKNNGVFFYTTAFLLIYQFALSMVDNALSSDFILWLSDISLPFFIIGCWLAIISSAFAVFFCTYLFEPLKTTYLVAARTSLMDILPLAYKIIDPPLDLFLLNSDVRKWIRVILMILIFGFRLRVFLVRVPYYYYNAMSLFLKFSFIQFGLSIINLFMMIFGATIDTHSFVMIYFGGVIVAFLPKISSIVLMSKIKRDASKDMDTIKSANDFHWRLFALDTAINMGVTISKIQRKSMDSDYEYIFYGILSSHKARCHKKGCGCRLLLKYSENLTPNTSPAHIKDKDILQNLKFELLRELYREGVKKFPFDTEIKIGLANLIFENKRRSYAPSISLVHTLNFAEQSIQIRVLAVMLLEKIESKLISDYANSINIKEIVDFQAASQKLRILIESSTAKFLNFWETYKAPDPPIMKLYNCSEVLNKEADQISAMWERITRDYKKLSYPDHLLYGLYQSLVRSAPYSAEKILRTYFSFANAYDPEKIREFLVTPENVHESNNILVCIAMKREKLGIVTFITPNVEEILQFKQSDVIDKDVNLMMPDFFRERHKRILLAHVENSRTTIFNRNRQVFTQKKDGYIIPFTIYVTMFPYFQGELSYFGLLRPMSTFDDFMLVLSDGTIDSFTENIGKALNLNPQTLKKYKLSDISKDLARLHKALLPFATGEGGPRKSNFYSKRQSNGLSFFESSYSLGKQNTATLDNVGQPTQLPHKKEEDEAEVEDDGNPGANKNTSRLNSADLIRAYDLFTSTGVATSLYPIGGSRHIEEAKLEYTAIISEENILGNHLRVFRFQSTATDEDMARNTQMLTDIRDDQTEPLKSEIRSQKLQSEYSVAWTVIPADQGIKMRTEEEINFRNPFYVKSSMEDSGATPGISMKNTKSSNEHQTDQLQGKDLEGQKPESPVDIHNLVLKKTSSAWKTAKLEGSQEEEIPEKQVKLEKVQLKKFLRDNQIILGDDQVDKNSVTSQAKADKVNAKLERAIHLDDKEFSFRVLTYSIVCFCFLSVGMVIYLYIMAEANLTEVRNNINILELSSDRAREIVEIDRNSRMIYLFQKGLAPLVRHTDDDAISNQLGLRELALNVSLLNNRLRSEIYKIHSTDQLAFYALNRVETKQALTKIRQINSFDLVTELSSAALELYNLLWNKPDADNQKLRFILDNSLNDFLVNNDAAIQILKENSSVAVQDIETTIIDILIIRISCGLVILSFVIKIQISFVKMRSRLLDVFLTIKDFEVEQSLAIVNSFYSYLQENRKEHYLLEKIVNSKTNPYSKISVQKKQQSKAFKAKTGYFKGTNVPIIVNLLITSICLSVFVILLCILLRIFASARQSMDSSRLNVINAKTSLYKFELAFTSLYEYIVEDGTTKVANIDIGSDLQTNYDYLSSHNTLLTSLVKEDSSNAEINYLLQGDLCGLLSQNRTCYSSNSGVISKGLLAMNGQMLKAIKQVKDFYDSSDKSNASKTIALTMKDLIDAEELYDNFMKRAYVELDHVLMESLLDSISTFSITNLVFITFAVVTCLTLTKYLFLLVRTRMEDQRKGYKNFMRIIPVNIIMNNRFLKSYLMNNSKSILDSVKNKI